MRRYPVQPLLDLSGLTYSALLRGKNGEAYRAIRERGMTPYQAEKIAAKVGLLPYDVWPSWADDEFAELSVACPECGERFLPHRKNHLYCSPRCYQRQYQRAWKRDRYHSDPEFRERDAVRSRRYRADAARAIRLRERAYRAANREVLLARKRQWYRRNREEILAKQRVRDAARRGKDVAA